MVEKQVCELDVEEYEIVSFYRTLSNEQKETFTAFLETLKQFLKVEKREH